MSHDAFLDITGQLADAHGGEDESSWGMSPETHYQHKLALSPTQHAAYHACLGRYHAMTSLRRPDGVRLSSAEAVRRYIDMTDFCLDKAEQQP